MVQLRVVGAIGQSAEVVASGLRGEVLVDGVLVELRKRLITWRGDGLLRTQVAGLRPSARVARELTGVEDAVR